MSPVRLVHLSDLHFGVHSDLGQVRRLETQVPDLDPTAIVISGDLSQRARHGEYQRALAFVERMREHAPVFVMPGNHDAAWWTSPLGLRGRAPLHAKYRRYFGDDLAPVLEVPGAVIAGALSAHGVAFGSMTWNLRDTGVKGHLPAGEMARVRERFRTAATGTLRVVVVHHNVLRGEISRRMGLARWRQAQRRLRESGADLVLCGHDHQEGVGQIDGETVVSTASTHTTRTRGKRPSAFNLVTADETSISVRHLRWDRDAGTFRPSDEARFARRRR